MSVQILPTEWNRRTSVAVPVFAVNLALLGQLQNRATYVVTVKVYVVTVKGNTVYTHESVLNFKRVT
jgi:hypothetical protein